MSLRNFNYTARCRILREDVNLRLHRDGEKARFSLALRVEGYSFPPSATIYVEAIRGWQRRRWSCGTVASFVPPAATDATLDGFEPVEGVSFRVLVVEASGEERGKLLGEADNLRPVAADTAPATGHPLLPVEPSRELGEEVWAVDFSHNEARLLINASLGAWKEVAADALFGALVYPAIVRQVLTHILLVERYPGSDNLDSWMDYWLYFASRLPGISPRPEIDPNEGDSDSILSWIEEAVMAFSRSQRSLEHFAVRWKGGASSET